MDKEVFDRSAVREKLPADIASDDKTLTQQGRICYADQAVGAFVKAVRQERSDSIFVVTGDHSERFTFAKEQDLKTLSAIPCVFYGDGLKQSWFKPQQAGCHMQLAGTLAQLIAPTGFTYSAILPDMFNDTAPVFNHRLYAENGEMQLLSSNKEMLETANAAKAIAAYRVLKKEQNL